MIVMMKIVFKAWAASEASAMRGMAVHALLLARRSSGSKCHDRILVFGFALHISFHQRFLYHCIARSAKIRMLKELIGSVVGALAH